MATDGRDRGVLSPADRAFIEATEEERQENYSRLARSARRTEITKRTRNAILDFQQVHEAADIDEVVDELDNSAANALVSMVAVAYKAAEALDLDPETIIGAGETLAQEGRAESVRKRLESGDESVTIGDLGKVAAGRGLTKDEYVNLLTKRYLAEDPDEESSPEEWLKGFFSFADVDAEDPSNSDTDDET